MNEKILDRKGLRGKARSIKEAGKKIVFTNGCFDLLHIGHVRYLRAARQLADVLLIAVNSDRSMARIKGPGRPIVAQDERAEVLASLECVDYVTIFDEPDPLATIELVTPDVLVKGADWKEDAIIGRDVVEAAGGRVVRIPLTGGASTSAIIRKIVRIHCSRQ
ncbi:MAG: D-glycero-beta-D-manno-heptose 1-phosphate adenylyltransferase [Deltaproteobacteria bacterium]|nr:D-glycero-beta-D-manno-heptose 1-phosphate adenylyltransferase [Deltaproteobacteria bacterium]MBW2317596.1 D-glycero-beta-D-manno-heptose 1-phosphate adenylyltransferase [Deltaproteobacteria bacterium]OEU45210.1 MAG: glycerol-3-phosphate cytidylyltransferase [Desulfobacterales bacterium S7086C20]